MSSKLKLKSTAGGSLSLAVDDTLATDEIVEIPSEGIQPLDVNHGIESGSTDSGSWIKFPDGSSEMSGSISQIVTLVWSGTAPLKYSVWSSWIAAFPEGLFLETPVCVALITDGQVASRAAKLTTFLLDKVSIKDVYITSAATTPSTDSGALIFRYIAKGRWK